MLHAPESLADVQRGRDRLVFEELLLLQLGLLRWRRDRERGAAGPVLRGGSRLREARRSLPFELTRGQRRALTAILDDMASPRVMHRLLEGDVGCGKTVVALLAIVAAADSGYQSALMVPTEILAAQHARSVAELVPSLRSAVLSGSTAPRERRRLLAALAAGEIELLIGTQSLLGDAVDFRRLGLVVVDEQHRFGVGQRAALQARGERPHMLVMTATPIPRSLALACFGDLDLTLIEGRPPGRQPARTYVAEPGHRERVLRYLDHAITAGGQVVVITPRIDPTDGAEVVAATQAVAQLRRHPLLGRRRIELLHGRLGWEEKAAVLGALRRGAIDLLVATSVIEVGLDVPGLSVVAIERPECFGLSQLHQLRGRVGRGDRQGECILQLDDATPPASRERLRQFARTRDGFQVAVLDLEARGIGDLLGNRQHGWDGLKVADLLRDRHLLEAARRTAIQLLSDDPELEGQAPLRAELDRWLGAGSASCISESTVRTG
jgi:ATP-dependent DNA helicase RecG